MGIIGISVPENPFPILMDQKSIVRNLRETPHQHQISMKIMSEHFKENHGVARRASLPKAVVFNVKEGEQSKLECANDMRHQLRQQSVYHCNRSGYTQIGVNRDL